MIHVLGSFVSENLTHWRGASPPPSVVGLPQNFVKANLRKESTLSVSMTSLLTASVPSSLLIGCVGKPSAGCVLS